jgi:hypothetical protein
MSQRCSASTLRADAPLTPESLPTQRALWRGPGQAVRAANLSTYRAEIVIMCDDSKRWASLTVLPISVKIPLGERREMLRMLRFLPLAGSAIYGIVLAVLALAGLWTAFVVFA